MKRLYENLTNKNENYILPFLWIHGEGAEKTEKMIQKIYASGIRAICVEARPHKDFNGPKWFEDLEVIIKECKRLGMKMWLLDDSHFPTGYANGEVKKKYPQYLKTFLCRKTYDFVGPITGSGANLKYALKSDEDKILGVYLQRRIDFEHIDPTETIDVTDSLQWVSDYNTERQKTDFYGNMLPGICGKTPVVYFDLPEGNWCLNVVFVSREGGEKSSEDYLNPIVAEATDVLIKTVYEPVYERFTEEFGKTFMGFFTDEPHLGNIHGAEFSSIGRNSEMVLPWKEDMLILLTEKCKKLGGLLSKINEKQIIPLLPLLFVEGGDIGYALRYAYMDLVSELYSKNFDGRITKWCHEHGCLHIGHCIEDNHAATRLGSGTGHLFRAMKYSDMAGIDVVLHQLLPGLDNGLLKSMHKPGWEGEFFTYLLGKLGSSLAHLDAKKQGRCICELFGAYGWAEGNRLAKWMADHMLVRGVNYMVPHAYNCASFPDNDCPPHFYADGHNPQYPEFKVLMDYCNRMCHLLSGGVSSPCVALFFNAEGEWSGHYMETEKPAAVLTKNLIDFDLISADYLKEAMVKDGKLCINGMEIPALVFPWAEALPKVVLEETLRVADAGLKIWFVNALPSRITDDDDSKLLDALNQKENICVVELYDLAKELQQNRIVEIEADIDEQYLRYYHYIHNDGDVYFFVNENNHKEIYAKIKGIKQGKAYQYDPFENKVRIINNPCDLYLVPYGSQTIIITEKEILEAEECEREFKAEEIVALKKCMVELADMSELIDGRAAIFEQKLVLDEPRYISEIAGFETFVGRIKYVFTIYLNEEQSLKTGRLKLEGVMEGATAFVNGINCGTKICPNYYFLVDCLQKGENTIEIEVNTTLGRCMNDYLSSYLPMEPTGVNNVVLQLGTI